MVLRHIENRQLLIFNFQVDLGWRTLFLRALRPLLSIDFSYGFAILDETQLFQNMLHQLQAHGFIRQVRFIQDIARHPLPQLYQLLRKFGDVVLPGLWGQRALLWLGLLLTWWILLSHYFLHVLLLLLLGIFKQALVHTNIIASIAPCRLGPALDDHGILCVVGRCVALNWRYTYRHLAECVHRQVQKVFVGWCLIRLYWYFHIFICINLNRFWCEDNE